MKTVTAFLLILSGVLVGAAGSWYLADRFSSGSPQQESVAQKQAVALKANVDELSAALRAMESTLSSCSNALGRTEGELARERAANDPLRRHIERLTAEGIEKKVKRDKVDAQLSQAAKRVAQTQAELADAKELLNAAQSYNREMSAKLAQLEAQRSAAVDAQQALQTEVERLEQTTVTRQELAEATRAELAVAQKRVAALESTVAAERQRLATLQAECNALKRQIAAAKVGGQGPMAPAAE